MRNVLINLLYKLIQFIECIEYRNFKLNENDINKKIIKAIDLPSNIAVKSDFGFLPISQLYITQPYQVYKIILENGLFLECADDHIIFDSNLNEIFVKDLKIGNLIFTNRGHSKVISVNKLNKKISMCDVTVEHLSHRYFSNGILSHNTVTAAITILHFITFNNDKNVMIIANKADTTMEILSKITSIYKLLPMFLQTGVKNYAVKSVVFENGCRIKTSARTKTPAIGFTIDFLYLDEFAHIPTTIIEPFYQAAFPVVSAVNNSKIIITSTPNGMNLFYRLLVGAEKPIGDPQKNPYTAMRVYWWQVPGRHVTYVRLDSNKLYQIDVTPEQVVEQIKNKFETVVEIKYDKEILREVIHVQNNDKCTVEDIRKMIIMNVRKEEFSIVTLGDISTWKEDEIKGIGSEEAFNQEYNLRFINSSRSLLDEKLIEDMTKNKKEYKYVEIPEFTKRLRFDYSALCWITDEEIFNPVNRKKIKGIISVDISEGLGQDYSVINIFQIAKKSKEVIEIQKESYDKITDFYKLQQIGLYRSNITSVYQLAEILYLIAFEYFDPENFKIVLELNTYGGELLVSIANVFDGNNNFGSNIFLRYKHRVDATEEKIGLKINDNKNMLVKDYQDAMQRGDISINNEDNIRECTCFVKHITSSGNTVYRADGSSSDDTVMTLVDMTTVFKKPVYKDMVNDILSQDKVFESYINECLKNSEIKTGTDYSSFISIKNRIQSVKESRIKAKYDSK